MAADFGLRLAALALLLSFSGFDSERSLNDASVESFFWFFFLPFFGFYYLSSSHATSYYSVVTTSRHSLLQLTIPPIFFHLKIEKNVSFYLFLTYPVTFFTKCRHAKNVGSCIEFLGFMAWLTPVSTLGQSVYFCLDRQQILLHLNLVEYRW